MILYIIGFCVLCIILFYLYIKIKFKFWSIQPVFHFYDIYYWIFNVGIIRKELPEKNRYTNFKNIKTQLFEELDKNKEKGNSTLKQLISLIQLHYFQNKENKYSPNEDNIFPYFIGHNTKSFWSYYEIPELLIDNKTGKTIEETSYIGVITSRPLHVRIINQKDGNFDVNYVDYLCVNRTWRKKNIAPQLIQTHEYNQSHLNKKIVVSLFKREEELTGIIPLTVYKTYCYNMKNWTKPETLQAKITLLTGDKQNIYYLYNFINETMNKWEITIYPEMTNIMELVATKNIHVKMLVVNGNIEAVYIFKKTCTFIEKEKEILSCIASINGSLLTIDEFIKGFKMSLWSIIEQKENNNFQYLIIEDLSDNNILIDNISKRTKPFVISPTAYFFYNFAYNPFKSNRCLILN